MCRVRWWVCWYSRKMGCRSRGFARSCRRCARRDVREPMGRARMTLLALYDRSLLGRADVAALTFEDDAGAQQHFTFGELDALSTQLAGALTARGVGAGDRLALWLANSPSFITLWLACVKLGVIV